MTERTRLSNALIVSLLLHAALIGLLPLLRAASRSGISPPPLLDVDVVSLPPVKPAAPAPAAAPPPAPAPAPRAEEEPAEPPAPAITLPQTQIVSVPEAGEEKAPEKTRFLSERDVSVSKESIRKGEPQPGEQRPALPAGEAGEGGGKERAAARGGGGGPPRAGAARQGTARLPPAPALDDLLPSASDIARESLRAGGETPEGARGKPGDRGDLLAYGDQWKAQSQQRGILDFIPDVHEGDVTLLNTKAEKFAPFVRRVAIRVFQNLVILLRRNLQGAAGSADESVAVEAIMDRKGNMVSLKVKDRSATSTLGTDRDLQVACQQAFFDRNPPPGAEAADGQIHFLLTTRVGVLVGPDGHALQYAVLFSAGLL